MLLRVGALVQNLCEIRVVARQLGRRRSLLSQKEVHLLDCVECHSPEPELNRHLHLVVAGLDCAGQGVHRCDGVLAETGRDGGGRGARVRLLLVQTERFADSAELVLASEFTMENMKCGRDMGVMDDIKGGLFDMGTSGKDT